MNTPHNGEFFGEKNGAILVGESLVEGKRVATVKRYLAALDSPRWIDVPVTTKFQATIKSAGWRLASYDKKLAEELGIAHFDGNTYTNPAPKANPPAVADPIWDASSKIASEDAASAPIASTRTIADIIRDSERLEANEKQREVEVAEALKICRDAKAKEDWNRIVAKHGGKPRSANVTDNSWGRVVEKHSSRT